ncbi:sulfite exporter TauE/SafE family protein [Modestobacter sp. Leaf380]|uniref:sulfite exporter TauE/SafE family protein n=1 Tax=Modestobacter sp. Leaf380 TaxID=1736356 RepID=UPI0006F4D5DF|nr:sulfite exporter TauE/SafE family protein [Modestobacter sp. Leaf380]KQS69362.1 transporter [Modestobacter sp. Leaf380]
MSVWQWLFLLVAGVGGGLTGSIAGMASLVSYPALLATGLPPVTANVTNSVALITNALGAASASRVELTGQKSRVLLLVPAAAVGGVIGAVLLLTTPDGVFEKVVPFLIGAAALAILVQRPPRELAVEGAVAQAHRPRRHTWGLAAATCAVGVYGGYFGAAAGVLMLALLLLATGETVPRGNALRNVVVGSANGIAALGYAVFADIAWWSALPLAIGLFVGGRLGPRVVRRVNGTVLRRVIAVVGLGLALQLGFQAFG